MRLLIMGPPGSGKGTQAVQIAGRLGIPAISTGDIFRAHATEGSALGRIAREYMDAGEYVPDQVTNAMVRDRLQHSDCDTGFLLDGYPRTVDQVAELDDMLLGAGLSAVIELVVDREVLISRLLERARSQNRSDDTAEVIRRRQDLYAEQTAPLTALYAERGLVHAIEGDGSVSDVSARISAALATLPAPEDQLTR